MELLLLVVLAGALQDAPESGFSAELLSELSWREIGPAVMGGRVTDIAVDESHPQHFYMAAATGGVWETRNNGTTWKPIFERYGTSSIGDIAIAPSNSEIVWVGTGEANLRNSVTPGNGVYKSVDGGKSFTSMGLRRTRHIGRICIHPTNPEIVLVAALGCAYAPSRERGLYKTTDGGQTWTCVKFIDEDTGFVDIVRHPSHPDILFAGTYAARRDAFSGSGSPTLHTAEGGVFKSTDGGDTWTKLSTGLPTVPVGRVGLDISRRNPAVVMAIMETRRSTAADRTPTPGAPYLGITGEDEDAGVVIKEVVENGPAAKAGVQLGDIVKQFAGKKIDSYEDLVTEIRTSRPGDKVKLLVQRNGEEVMLEVTVGSRDDESGAKEISHQSFVQDADAGGIYRSKDGGETWSHLSKLNPRPFYYSQIRIDPTDDARIYVLGVNLHVSTDGGRTWKGDGARSVHVDHHALWINPRDGDHMLLGCDGGINITFDRGRTWEHLNNLSIGQFYAVGLDMSHPYRVYGGLQDNGTWVGPSRSRNRGIVNEDWAMLYGGDGFYVRVDPSDPNTIYCGMQYGLIVRVDRRTGAATSIRPKGGKRWEWNTPIELSPHDPKRLYTAAHCVFESSDRGATWQAKSGDLCRTEKGSVTALGVSPVDPDVLWAGTNDGAVHVTRDRGATWVDVTGNIPGLPPLLWVTRIESSRTFLGAAYLTVEGRRKDDLRTFVWKTEDFGATWISLTATLPSQEPVYVIRQDPKNASVLYLGTERAVYVSLDDGRTWVSLQRNMPVVPVHDLAIHPREGELVAATHGRSLWILDVAPIQLLSPRGLAAKSFLCEPTRVTLWQGGKMTWFGGSKEFIGRNPPRGCVIWYTLKEEAEGVSLRVLDAKGGEVAKLDAPRGPGLHRVTWNMHRRGGTIAPGEYWVELATHGMTQEQPLRVERDPQE